MRFRGGLAGGAISVLIAAACAGDSGPAVVDDGEFQRGSGATRAQEERIEGGSLDQGVDETAASTTIQQAPDTTSTVTASSATEPPPSTVALGQLSLAVELVGEASRPLAIGTRAGSADLYVAEQDGRILHFPDGVAPPSAEAVLDLRGSVSTGTEQGLLGFAFSADGTRLYVNYTDAAGDSVVVRYVMDGNTVDPGSAEILLQVDQPRGNHNGGHVVFGPDGFLYVGLGDGGGSGDPGDNGQNPDTLLGSILRLDVSVAGGYSIPADNPFAGSEGADEVFLWGVRNPWRFSFDPANGDLWVADVGQNQFEEVTVLRAAEGGGNGANLGWNEVEGFEVYLDGTEPENHTAPIATYSQVAGRCSVTGGEVYRGTATPSLVGVYVFGDFCTGELFGIDAAGDGQIVPLDIAPIDELTSFGVDSAGELYALSRTGDIFRIVAA